MQQFFYVRKEKHYEQVKFSEIIYIKAKRGYIQIVCEQRTLLVMNSLLEVKKFLPVDMFCRIHISYIVALERIKRFDIASVELHEAPVDKPYKPGLAQMTKLSIGLTHREEFLRSISIMLNKSGHYRIRKNNGRMTKLERMIA